MVMLMHVFLSIIFVSCDRNYVLKLHRAVLHKLNLFQTGNLAKIFHLPWSLQQSQQPFAHDSEFNCTLPTSVHGVVAVQKDKPGPLG